MSRVKEAAVRPLEHARIDRWPAPLEAATAGAIEGESGGVLSPFRWRYADGNLVDAGFARHHYHCFAFPRELLSPHAMTLSECSSLLAVNAASYLGFLEVFLGVAYGLWESSHKSQRVELRLTAVPLEKALMRRTQEADGSVSVSVPSLSSTTSFSHYLLTLTYPTGIDIADSSAVLKKLMYKPKKKRRYKPQTDSAAASGDEEEGRAPMRDFAEEDAKLPRAQGSLRVLHHLTPTRFNELACFVAGFDVPRPGLECMSFDSATSREVALLSMARASNAVAKEFGAAFAFGSGLPFGGRLSFLLNMEQWSPTAFPYTVLPWIFPETTMSLRQDRAFYVRQRRPVAQALREELGALAAAMADPAVADTIEELCDMHVVDGQAEEVFDRKETKRTPRGERLAEARWKAQCLENVARAETEALRPLHHDPRLAALRLAHDQRRAAERRERERTGLPTPPAAEARDREAYVALEAAVRREVREALLSDVQRTNVLNFFETVWRIDAVMGSSKKAQVLWYHEHLRLQPAGKGHFSFKRQHGLPNLSSFGSLMALTMVDLESLCHVTHYHRDIVAGMMAILHTMTGSNFHANMLLAGRAELGKSYVLEALRDFCIPKTVVYMNKMTPAALTGLDDAGPAGLETNDIKVFMFDDIQPELLGIESHANNNGRAAETNNSALEALMKQWTTTGRVNYKTLVIEENGFRRTIEVETLARSMIIAGTNARITIMPAATKSRYNTRDTEQGKRNDGVTVTQSALRGLSPKQEALKRRFVERFRRTQCFATIYGMMRDAGVLPKIDIECHSHLIAWVQQCAALQKRSLNIRPRAQEMLRFYQTGAVLMDACDRFFDLDVSPYCERPWQPEDILAWGRHLVGLQEHFTLSIGLMRDSFEDISAKKAELTIYGCFHQYLVPDQKARVMHAYYPDAFALRHAVGAESAQRNHSDLVVLGPMAGLALREPDAAPRGARPAEGKAKLFGQVTIVMRPNPERVIEYNYDGTERPSAGHFYEFPAFRLAFFEQQRGTQRDVQIRQLANAVARVVENVEAITIERAIANLADTSIRVPAYAKNEGAEVATMRRDKTLAVPALEMDASAFYLPLQRDRQALLDKQPAAHPWDVLVAEAEKEQGRGLKDIIGSALCHRHAEPRTLIYGACIKGEPYLFDTIEVAPRHAEQRMHAGNHQTAVELAALLGDELHEDVQEQHPIVEQPMTCDIDAYVVHRWLHDSNVHAAWRNERLVPSSLPTRLMFQLSALRYPVPPLAPYPLTRPSASAAYEPLEVYTRPCDPAGWMQCVNEVPGARHPFAPQDVNDLLVWQQTVREPPGTEMAASRHSEPELFRRESFRQAFEERLRLYMDRAVYRMRANGTLGKRRIMSS